MKTCTKCSETKDLSLFYKGMRRKDGSRPTRADCKKCTDSVNRQWASLNKHVTRKIKNEYYRNNKQKCSERGKAFHYKSKYGLTQEAAYKIIASQNYTCKICGTTEPRGYSKKFHIDHCHKTGKVRAALCNNCNVGLGYFCDNLELLNKAADYLSEHSE